MRFNPATVGRQHANLTRITNPQENVPLAQLGAEIISWENRIIEYEARPGSDVVSENLKIATLVAMCPGKLREHLNLNAPRFKTFQDIREEIFGYLEATYQVASTAMDIGAVTRRQGPCFLCGGEHLARDCRKGKGKGAEAKGAGKPLARLATKARASLQRKGAGAGKGKPSASTAAYCTARQRLGHSKEQCWHQKPKSLASIDPQLSALQSAFAKAAMEAYQQQQSASSQSVPAQATASPSSLPPPGLQASATPASVAAGMPVSNLQVRRLNSLHLYDPGKTSVNSLVSAPASSSSGTYRAQATLESGAAASVAPKQAFPDYPVRATESSERGMAYAAANGGLVPDEGRVDPVFATDEGLMLTVSYSVADVHKVLTSAASVCNRGFGIWLDEEGCESYILDKSTGDKIAVWQEDGVYVYNMNVLPSASADFSRQA